MQKAPQRERHHPNRNGNCPIPSGRRQQNVYMGNKFLALRKSEVAKVAPDRAGVTGRLVRGGEGRYGIWAGNIGDISAWR